MSTYVVGFRPADEKWKQMKAIWESCESAGVEIPLKVLRFFDHIEPRGKPGAEVDLKGSVELWSDDSRSGFEVDVSKLPSDVKIIRFYNSY